MTGSWTVPNPVALGAELRGAGLLFATGGAYGVLVLEAELSAAALAIGALIGVGVAVVDLFSAPIRSRVVYAAITVALLGALLAFDWVVATLLPWIGPYLASVAIGIGGAGLLGGVALWVRERYASK